MFSKPQLEAMADAARAENNRLAKEAGTPAVNTAELTTRQNYLVVANVAGLLYEILKAAASAETE